jgi:hypothetical protein
MPNFGVKRLRLTNFSDQSSDLFYLTNINVVYADSWQNLHRPNWRIETVDWGRGYGAITPSHLGQQAAGPLCTAFSSARHLQRSSTSSDMRDLC